VGWGVVAAPALAAYAVWRLFTAAAPATRTEHLSRLLLWALAAVIVFLVVSGPVTVWTYGRALKVFGWFAIPSPTGNMPGLHSLAENAHVQVSHVAPWLAGVEAAVFAWVKLRK
jgi:cytochrome b561